MSFAQNKENLVDFINKHGNLVISDWISIQNDFLEKTSLNQDDLKSFGNALLVRIKAIFLIEIFGEQIAQKILSFDQTNESEKGIENFLELMLKKQVDINLFSKVFLDLQNSVVDNLDQKPGYLSYINASVTILNKIFIDILKIYNQKFFVLLNEYKNAIDTSNIVCKFGIDTKISYVNDRFRSIVSQQSEALMDKEYFSFVKIPDKTINKDFVLDFLEKNNIWTGEIIIGNRYLLCTILPIFNDKGDKVEYISIGTDITTQKALEIKVYKQTQLELQNKEKVINELQVISQTKDEFLNVASHELRTPMTIIQGYVSMILAGDAGDVNEEMKDYLDQMLISSQRLIGLINDMLDIAKLESGKMQFFYEKINLREFFDDIYFGINQLSKQKGQELIFNLNYEDAIDVDCDRVRLKQVYENILSNAVKFTPENGVIKLDSFIQNNMLITKISDNGIGIPSNNLSTIFDKFSQVKNSLTRDISGTGLGLAIVKKNLESLNGMVFVESEEGKGTTFTVSVPI